MDKFLIRPNKKRKIDDNSTSSEDWVIKWTKIKDYGLDCDYGILFSKKVADILYQRCEKEIEYYSGDLTKVKVYGKWHDVPRKQVAFGDLGLKYTFSGTTIPAKTWTPLIEEIRDRISGVTGQHFNFVLVNRYKDGNDHMGEHRDDEKELEQRSPIASLSLGQNRDFIFKHCEARGNNSKRKIATIKLELQHGSLLMMNYPTNIYWYHSLPVRKQAICPRINMTFRKMIPSISKK